MKLNKFFSQYICDKFAPNSKLYPSDPQARAIVNHRLCFNSSFFYSSIAAGYVGPLFFDYPQTEMGIKRVYNAVNVLEEHFKRLGKKYVAGDDVTIADISLACSMTVLETIQFDFSKYPLVKDWYATFKKENPDMWIYPAKVRIFKVLSGVFGVCKVLVLPLYMYPEKMCYIIYKQTS